MRFCALNLKNGQSSVDLYELILYSILKLFLNFVELDPLYLLLTKLCNIYFPVNYRVACQSQSQPSKSLVTKTTQFQLVKIRPNKSSRPEVFLGKVLLKICSKFQENIPRRNVISIKLICNQIEIALRHGCFSVNLLRIF